MNPSDETIKNVIRIMGFSEFNTLNLVKDFNVCFLETKIDDKELLDKLFISYCYGVLTAITPESYLNRAYVF